ncbi:MAG: aminomethyl-transferring glycine dehydrogenase subunit GcvPA [Candidatus Geothermarchaeales archaeon]
MSSPYIPNDNPEIISDMLKEIGVEGIEDLYTDIPREIILREDLKLPPGETEDAVKRLIEEKLEKNLTHRDIKVFLGGGVWIHHVPSVVHHLISRGEFLTSYTPYQPEMSQGLLQVLFEYQSMICELTGMEVANCSMYDWGSGAAEAILMSSRVKRRFKALVAGNISPQRMEVMKTYIEPAEIKIERVPIEAETGGINIEKLQEALDEEVCSVYIENPSYIGSIEEKVEEISDVVHEVDALFIVGVDPLSLGILKPPGEYGADVVVGEGQPLGSGVYFGGPLLGIFAAMGDMGIVRQMPGRIIGMTQTQDGSRRAFSMILQTREQHIRRERATSNICTNEALTAVAAALYLSLMGKRGFRRLAEALAYRSVYAAHRLSSEAGVMAPPYEYSHFRDFIVRVPRKLPVGDLLRKGLERGFILGYPVDPYFPQYENSFLTSFSEIHSRDDIEEFVGLVREIVEEA